MLSSATRGGTGLIRLRISKKNIYDEDKETQCERRKYILKVDKESATKLERICQLESSRKVANGGRERVRECVCVRVCEGVCVKEIERERERWDRGKKFASFLATAGGLSQIPPPRPKPEWQKQRSMLSERIPLLLLLRSYELQKKPEVEIPFVRSHSLFEFSPGLVVSWEQLSWKKRIDRKYHRAWDNWTNDNSLVNST